MSFVYLMLTLITEYAQPFVFRFVTGNFDFYTNRPTPVGPFLPQALGLSGFLIQFAFLLPIAVYGSYYANLIVIGQPITWKIHLWLGSILMAGAVGWGLSYLAVPPYDQPTESTGN